jgi:photosystem I subunit 8
MTATYAAHFLPAILVPIIGWVFPALSIVLLFFYIEKEGEE